MKVIPLQKLALLHKTLGMTTSANDAEALSALRFANKLMKEHAVSWDDLFSRLVGVEEIRHSASGLGPEDDIEADEEIDLKTMISKAFDELRGNVNGGFGEFIASLEKQWQEKGYLSPAQRKPLLDAVSKQRERRKRDD